MAVREYVKQCGLEEILIPSVGHWTDINDFRLDALPNSFVLKTTHGSGDVMIVKDKSLITEENIKKQFKPLLSERYGALEGGRHYMRITPALVAEKLIEQDEESRKISSSLIDYKIWCFNGQPQFIWACCNRTSQGTDVMTYDLN